MSFIRRATSLPSPNTFPAISPLLKSCKSIRNLKQIHAQIIQKGGEEDSFLITQLISLCNSVSKTEYAKNVFDRVAQPNVYLWNSIIKGHCDNSLLINTINLFKRMKHSDITPDNFTFPSLIKACSNETALREGSAIHCAVVRVGVENDVFVRTGLIDFYGKCREINSARKLFDTMLGRNVVSWTAMIVAYVNFGNLIAARNLFDEMPKRNTASWNAMIDGYVKIGDLRNARELFDLMPDRNVVSFTSLIDGYAKAGDMVSARFLFDQSAERDIVSWSALISGYTQNGHPGEAVKIFREMCKKNLKPDEFILVSLMSACSQVGNVELAKWVDLIVQRSAINLQQAYVVAALIDMNAKCGNMERAIHLFEKMPQRDLITYCSVIQGLSIHGYGGKAVGLFSRMLDEGLKPDNVAFTVILAVCSHAGLVEDGLRYFYAMKDEYHIVPSSDHYACMVDLLGRAGHLETAYELLKSMPVEPHAGAWGALLGACGLHGNIELGEIVAGHLFNLEPQNAGNYVLLSNIYAAENRWSDVSLVRDMMRERGVRKIPGCSWI